MHEYLMEVERFFGGRYRFQVTASSKEEAKIIGKGYVHNIDHGGNFIKETLKVVKKLKPSFGSSET